MEQPEGFRDHGPGWVWRLLKFLYGLKQARLAWHKKLHSVHTEKMGFECVLCNHSIWVYKHSKNRIIIPVFVNNMTIAAKTISHVKEIIEKLKTHFKLQDLGPTEFLLDVRVEHDRSTCTLQISQCQYLLNILACHGTQDCNPVSTLLDPYAKLSKDQSPQTPEKVNQHLLTLHVQPRTSALGRLKQLLRYLKGTADYCIAYRPDPMVDYPDKMFHASCNADHDGNCETNEGCSTSGMLIKMGTGTISWSSCLQSVVTLSTREAEYVSTVSAGQEILWLRNLFTEFG